MIVREIDIKTIRLWEIEEKEDKLILMMQGGELLFLVPIDI